MGKTCGFNTTILCQRYSPLDDQAIKIESACTVKIVKQITADDLKVAQMVARYVSAHLL